MNHRAHPRFDDASSLARDVDLMLRIQARDRSALEALYGSYYPGIARFLARFAPDREDIEEIITDTFMVVWTRAGAFRSESRVSTWLIGIAYRVAMRSLRRQKGQRRGRTALMAQESDMTQWLDAAFARLPDEQRVTVTLAYQMGFSVGEISRIMESPIGTVKSRMFLARQHLREWMLEPQTLARTR
jgi:RNA polymerase sigma-70 factor, ECF subfamily